MGVANPYMQQHINHTHNHFYPSAPTPTAAASAAAAAAAASAAAAAALPRIPAGGMALNPYHMKVDFVLPEVIIANGTCIYF